MQKILLLIALLTGAVRLCAQQPRYIYIEAEKGQPFYVKIDNKVHSSAAGGYIILSGLKENNYTLFIGFPKNAFPEQRFTFALNENDRGFQLKNLGEKGWGLFDLQTMALLTNDYAQTLTDTNQVRKTDAFSTLLSKVVNDPAVLIENKKPAVVTPAPQPVVAEKKNKPVKLLEWKTGELYEAMYIDDAGDTIRISYPIDKSIVTAPPATPLEDAKKEEPSDSIVVVVPEAPAEKPVVKVTNSDCKNVANDQDVDKLRIRIVKEEDSDAKLTAAKKYFRSKCFTVKQVRALAELFGQDENKYQFFDIAYPFIADAENFSQLETELQLDYYKNRFRAMIKK